MGFVMQIDHTVDVNDKVPVVRARVVCNTCRRTIDDMEMGAVVHDLNLLSTERRVYTVHKGACHRAIDTFIEGDGEGRPVWMEMKTYVARIANSMLPSYGAYHYKLVLTKTTPDDLDEEGEWEPQSELR